MKLPIVAIVGRPNVGKSRLFNRLVGKYRALVDDQPGVTRDRHYGYADWRGKTFLVVDTGGLIPGAEEPLNQKVWQQAFLAIAECDLLICLLDGLDERTPLDEALVQELRKIGKPTLYVVNKVDTATHEKGISDFAKMGLDPLIAVSAEHGRGISDLLEAIYDKLPPQESHEKEQNQNALRLSIVGRPNVGKSTLLNFLAGEERSIVHEEAGTTRDSVDVTLCRGEQKYVFVDTAGIKRKKQTKTRLEKFSVVTVLKAIEQSQIVLFLLDALEGVSHHDLHLLHLIWESKKGLIILVNKWDLMKTQPQSFVRDLRPQLRELQNVPILCIAAKTGKYCSKMWEQIDQLWKGMQKRFPTAQLNNWLEEVSLDHPLPIYKGREVKFYYGTQVKTSPPHIVIFTNEPKGIPNSYKSYLRHRFEEVMDVQGVPLILSFRHRK